MNVHPCVCTLALSLIIKSSLYIFLNIKQENLQIHVVVDLGFTTLLTSQVISVAFYSDHEKSNKFFAQRL